MDKWILSLIFLPSGYGTLLYVLLTCGIAGALSFFIGLERQLRGETAGVRTHALLSVGCSLLMTISIYAIHFVNESASFSQNQVSISFDSSRIAAGVVTGIGFLGSGVIIKDRLSVRGLSTASTLWICAAVGLACGSGFVLEAIVATAFTMVLLIGLGKILDLIDDKSPSVIIVAKRGFPIIAEVREFSDQNGLTMRNVSILRYEADRYYTKVNFARRTNKTLIQYVSDECSLLPHVIAAEPTTKETIAKYKLDKKQK